VLAVFFLLLSIKSTYLLTILVHVYLTDYQVSTDKRRLIDSRVLSGTGSSVDDDEDELTSAAESVGDKYTDGEQHQQHQQSQVIGHVRRCRTKCRSKDLTSSRLSPHITRNTIDLDCDQSNV